MKFSYQLNIFIVLINSSENAKTEELSSVILSAFIILYKQVQG